MKRNGILTFEKNDMITQKLSEWKTRMNAVTNHISTTTVTTQQTKEVKKEISKEDQNKAMAARAIAFTNLHQVFTQIAISPCEAFQHVSRKIPAQLPESLFEKRKKKTSKGKKTSPVTFPFTLQEVLQCVQAGFPPIQHKMSIMQTISSTEPSTEPTTEAFVDPTNEANNEASIAAARKQTHDLAVDLLVSLIIVDDYDPSATAANGNDASMVAPAQRCADRRAFVDALFARRLAKLRRAFSQYAFAAGIPLPQLAFLDTVSATRHFCVMSEDHGDTCAFSGAPIGEDDAVKIGLYTARPTYEETQKGTTHELIAQLSAENTDPDVVVHVHSDYDALVVYILNAQNIQAFICRLILRWLLSTHADAVHDPSGENVPYLVEIIDHFRADAKFHLNLHTKLVDILSELDMCISTVKEISAQTTVSQCGKKRPIAHNDNDDDDDHEDNSTSKRQHV